VWRLRSGVWTVVVALVLVEAVVVLVLVLVLVALVVAGGEATMPSAQRHCGSVASRSPPSSWR
jgi:hypothetical protein